MQRQMEEGEPQPDLGEAQQNELNQPQGNVPDGEAPEQEQM